MRLRQAAIAAATACLTLVPTAAGAAAASGSFKTPSGNIVCGWGYGAGFSSIECGIKSGLRPPPPPPHGGCSAGDYNTKRVSLTATGRTVPTVCAGDPGPFLNESKAPVLAYGKTWQGGGLWCISVQAGLTCGNKNGHGFFVSRAHWRSY